MLGFVFVILLAVILFGSTDIGRTGVISAASQTTHFQLVLIHTLRLLSIGTIIKYLQGQLPLHFVLFGTIPDLLFALSAVAIVIADPLGAWGSEFYTTWHHIGIQVFLGAGISMFFSMPSPIRIFRSKPDAAIIFEYPMMLAPNFTVPLFAVAHIYAICKYL